MGLETATTIATLNEANPLGTDPKSQGDDHIRMVKSVLKSDVMAASTIAAATEKSTPIDADSVGLVDSAASNARKKLTWANIKATLKTYFDTLYAKIGAIGSSGLTQNSARLLGRTTASAGAVEEITVGTGLSLSAGSLTCTVTGGVTTFNTRSGAVTLAASDITGIDGAGSGIDADLLDGQHGSYYAPASGGAYVPKDFSSSSLPVGVFCRCLFLSTSCAPGATVAGSAIYPENGYSASPAGTWRNIDNHSLSATYTVAIFQRIA